MTGELRSTFLSDGGQTAASVADELIAFLGVAERSLDIAIYDFHARAGASAKAADALEAAAARGVAVRVAFNVERCEHPADSRPMQCEPATIDGLEVPTRGVSDQGALMHHKYVVRDGASVWTGSTNWTDDAFSREENVLLSVDSPELAATYTRNFEKLWTRGHLERSGMTGDEVVLDHDVRARPYFTPHPPSLALLAASLIAEADRRVRIVSPVVTSGAILGTLAELSGRMRFDLSGAYDRTQMEEVQQQWAGVPQNRWKIDAWKVIAPRLSGKTSTPYSPTAVHDYMHAKFVVADQHLLAGSYNMSKHGEINAENALHVTGEFQASLFAGFADQVAARYREPVAAGPVVSP
ncbi:MAG: hypothetical protein HY240_01725 [Actinobacteria bacterium]|nr:hypothetical protein [Actinomycetota bacterium]